MRVARRPCGTRRLSHSRWQGRPGPGLTALQWGQESRGLLRGEQWGHQVEQQSGPGAFSGVHSETPAPRSHPAGRRIAPHLPMDARRVSRRGQRSKLLGMPPVDHAVSYTRGIFTNITEPTMRC